MLRKPFIGLTTYGRKETNAYSLPAICRGMQILNLFLGGTLHEHLPEAYGKTILHRHPSWETATHIVEISQGSRLYDKNYLTHLLMRRVKRTVWLKIKKIRKKQ